MGQAVSYMLPLFFFMLIPLWIPIIAIAGGAIVDRVRPATASPAEIAVIEIKERSAGRRREAGTTGRHQAQAA